jgi:hypothetical protein
MWLLALLLMASTAALGYRQGAIRVAVSFVGILLGVLLALPLGKLVKLLLGSFGVSHPVALWILCPVIAFVIISAISKACALPLHQKIDVYYKYRAGDLRLALWERLNGRLGLCLGLLNGAAYLVLISFGIYILSYWTFQVKNDDQDPRSLSILNRLGQDLQNTGFNKVARALDGLPDSYYGMADIVGVIYANPLIEARLARYPAFLSLAERTDFSTLGRDKQFTQMRMSKEPITGILKYQSVEPMINSPETLALVWNTIKDNLADLTVYLNTGRSAKYDSQKILGRWRFDVSAAAAAARRARPTMPASEMQRLRRWMQLAFAETTIVAMTDAKITLKSLPSVRNPAAATPAQPGAPVTVATETLQGRWKDLDDKYQINFDGKDDIFAKIEGSRLMMTIDGTALAFVPEGY